MTIKPPPRDTGASVRLVPPGSLPSVSLDLYDELPYIVEEKERLYDAVRTPYRAP